MFKKSKMGIVLRVWANTPCKYLLKTVQEIIRLLIFGRKCEIKTKNEFFYFYYLTMARVFPSDVLNTAESWVANT